MGMALDEPKDNEKPVQVNGIGVLVEDFVKELVETTTIDYVDNQEGQGFVIKNGEDCADSCGDGCK